MSNLLDKASILLTPTAFSSGALHSIKPIQTLGSELITNGDFATDTNWTKFSNATISGGTANLPNANAAIRQSGLLELNTKYKITYDVISSSGDNVLHTTRGGSSLTIDLPSSVGTHTVFGRTNSSGGGEFFISVKSFTANAVVDNVSLKKVTDGDFDFTRATTATRVGPNGLIQNVASGLPRIDFSGGTGQILLEPQSTNLEVNSGDLSTGWGVASSATQQVETGITPFGVSGNIKRITGATNNPPSWTDAADSLRKQYTVTATNPASFFTFSVYIKSAGSTTVNIQLRDNTLGPSVTTGSISLNSDWQRVSITKQFGTTTTRVAVVIGGTDGDILLSGAQLENSSFPTSLIPTSGTTVTRNKDLANGSGDTSLINSIDGVLYSEFAAIADDQTLKVISISDSSSNNEVLIRTLQTSSNTLQSRVRANSSNAAIIQNVLSDITQFNKIAIKYKSGDIGFFVNGVKVGTSTSAFTFINNLNQLRFEGGGSGGDFFGGVKTVAVFKEALTDAELIALTS